MNFLATAPVDGNGRAIRLFGQDVPVPIDPARLRQAHAEGGLVAGIRPEYIALGEGHVTFRVRPSLVESLGSEKYVYFDPGEHAVSENLRGDEERRKGLIARLPHAGSL